MKIIKRKSLRMLILLTVFLLPGCSGEKKQPDPPAEPEMIETETEYVPERPIWQVMGSEMEDWASRFEPETVKRLTYEIVGDRGKNTRLKIHRRSFLFLMRLTRSQFRKKRRGMLLMQETSSGLR